MVKRKETPDLMDGLLTGTKSQDGAEASTPIAPAPVEEYEAPPVKVSYYITPDADDALEEARRTLRRMLQPDHKHDVTKSKIVDAAILMAVEDLRSNGIDSVLAQALR